ncbi:C40 family peptidase [Thermus filiformis]|uniref:Peptigoglycan-binding protein LysM n=1 Tax=Thermus filiformis TaxID=276 RepID=A0A0A2WX51_THEFI|nr:C40 family peptidase [Thermus filiformis]KGQ22875.1 peptigoglycan-binding protein LysM [Thermus filiformis]
MRRRWIGAVLGLALALAQTHTVAPGDTLYSIARRYGTTVEELSRLNGLESFLLKPGQVLLLPKKEAPGPVHVVAPGDTLYSIARRYGTTVEELLRLNGLESSEIKVGQVLKLPEKAPSGPSAPPSPEGPPPTPSDEGEAKDTLDPESPLLKAVLKYLGVPYKYGANSPLALDCSAFVAQVYAELGVALPRTSREQYASLPPAEPLLPGDLVFFSFGGKEVDHVGVYLGRGVFAHASSYGSRVVIESLEAPFYRKTYRGARRVTASREPPPGPSAGR